MTLVKYNPESDEWDLVPQMNAKLFRTYRDAAFVSIPASWGLNESVFDRDPPVYKLKTGINAAAATKCEHSCAALRCFPACMQHPHGAAGNLFSPSRSLGYPTALHNPSTCCTPLVDTIEITSFNMDGQVCAAEIGS